MPRTALFVVDIQAELAQDPTTEIPHAERIRHAGAQILARSRAAIEQSRTLDQQPGLEIVIVQHEDRPGAGTLAKGSRPWALVFEPRGGDGAERVVSKQVRDTFESNPELASQLKTEGVDTIVVFGIQSECCVRSTCKGALAAGFRVVLLAGAHSTYDANGKQAEAIEKEVEEELRACGVAVVPWETWSPEVKSAV